MQYENIPEILNNAISTLIDKLLVSVDNNVFSASTFALYITLFREFFVFKITLISITIDKNAIKKNTITVIFSFLFIFILCPSSFYFFQFLV